MTGAQTRRAEMEGTEKFWGVSSPGVAGPQCSLLPTLGLRPVCESSSLAPVGGVVATTSALDTGVSSLPIPVGS